MTFRTHRIRAAWRRPAVVSAIASVVLVAVTACGGSGSSASGSAAPSSTRPTPSTGGVDPNAPEVVAPGDIPDNQVFVAYAGDGYSLKVPEGWARTTSGGATTFTDHYNSVRVTVAPAANAPDVAGAAAEVATLRRTVSSFRLGAVRAVRRPAGPVLLITYRAGSEPDPVTGKRVDLDVERYEFWRNGRQVTVTLSGAHGSDNVDPWKTVTQSFAWTP